VLGTALHGDIVAEHLADGLPERLRAVDHEQQPLLGVEAPVDHIGQQRCGDCGVLARAVPQPEREFLALGGDSERDDVGVTVQLDPVEHHHRQPQIGQRTVHQPPQLIAGPLHERTGHGRLRCRPGVRLDLLAGRLLGPPVLASRDAGQHPLEHDFTELVAVGEVLVGLKRHL
jgi:hypothetical protein